MNINALSIPSSKSYTQRALLLAALSTTPTQIINGLYCDDSYHLKNCIRELGGHVDDCNPEKWIVRPLPSHVISRVADDKSREAFHHCPTRSLKAPLHCWCENAGTVLRFLSGLTVLLKAPLILDGNRRLRKRPVSSIVTALQEAGVTSRFIAAEGILPILFERTKPLPREITIDPSLTSQLISGLMMACPLTGQTTTLKLTTDTVSKTYLDMTVKTLKDFGYEGISFLDDRTISIEPGSFDTDAIVIEKDWSSAATIIGAWWLTKGSVPSNDTIRAMGLNVNSIQGDTSILSFLSELSSAANTSSTRDNILCHGQPPGEATFDITHCPDIIGPLTVCSLFSQTVVTIKGINHTRIKECNRPETLRRELGRIGAEIEETDQTLIVHPLPSPCTKTAVLEPEDDHRMAMAFGLLSLKIPTVQIADRECVSKSYSAFWQNLELFRT